MTVVLSSLSALAVLKCPRCGGVHEDRALYLCRTCNRVLCAAQVGNGALAYMHRDGRGATRGYCGPLVRCEVTVDLEAADTRRRA